MTEADDDSDTPTGIEPPQKPHRHLTKTQLTLVIVPIAIMVTATQTANIVWADWVNSHPEGLIALSSLNRYLVAVVNHISPVAYYTIGFLRLLAPDPFFYLLGFYYGDRAIHWMERRTPTFGQMMRQLEELFKKAGYALVLILPNKYVCLIAGAAEMSIPVFVLLDVVGTIGRLILIAWLGDIFSGPIDSALAFVAEHRIPLLVLSTLIVGFTVIRELRAGTTDIQQLLELEDDLEADGELDE